MKIKYLNNKPIYEWEDSDDMNINTIGDTLSNDEYSATDVFDNIYENFKFTFLNRIKKLFLISGRSNHSSALDSLFEDANENFNFSKEDLYAFIQNNEPLLFILKSTYFPSVANSVNFRLYGINSFLDIYTFLLSIIETSLNDALNEYKIKKSPDFIIKIDFSIDPVLYGIFQSQSIKEPKNSGILINLETASDYIIDEYLNILNSLKNTCYKEVINEFRRNYIIGTFKLIKNYTLLPKNVNTILKLNNDFYKHIEINEFEFIKDLFQINQISMNYDVNISDSSFSPEHILINAIDIKESIEALSKLSSLLKPHITRIQIIRGFSRIQYKALNKNYISYKYIAQLVKFNIDELNNIFSPHNKINYEDSNISPGVESFINGAESFFNKKQNTTSANTVNITFIYDNNKCLKKLSTRTITDYSQPF